MNNEISWIRRFAVLCLRHGRVFWVVALLLAIPAGYRTYVLYAHLRSDVDALLPRDAPSVRAVDDLKSRMPGLQYLGVVVDTGASENVPAGERFIDDLAARIRAYPERLVRRVRVGDAEEHQYLEKNAALYTEVPDLEEIRTRIERRRDYEVKKETGNSFDDEDEKAPPLDFSDIESKYRTRATGRPRAENDRYSSKELHLTMLLVEVAEFGSGNGRSKELMDRVKADVASLGGPERYAPGMRAGYTGDVAISVEETEALMSDLSISSVLVLVLVIAVIALYYRWWRGVLVLVPPLLLSTLLSFGLASLPPFRVTELNSNTAFLASIIVGNGINFGIVLLARYVEERRLGVRPHAAMVTAIVTSRAGTLSAALAAGVSYGALAFTDFQGFRQFGYIGGIGMVLSWVASYTLSPSLCMMLDRDEKSAPGVASVRARPMSYVARFVARFPAIIVCVSVVLTTLAVARVQSFGRGSLEYDFSKLRRRDTWQSGEGYWGRRMDALLGTYLTPLVVLTSGREESREVARRLREEIARAPLSSMIDSVRTEDDVVPLEQEKKIALASDIRELMTPKMRSLVPDDKKADIDRLLGYDESTPVTASDVPATLKSGLVERDGRLDRAVLVFPKPSHALWQGPEIEDLVLRLRTITGRNDASGALEPGELAGSLPVSADILGSIERDGPRASLIAFLGVVATVVLLFRRSTTSLIVLGSLVVGVAWLAAASMALGVKINFANFIAFPITFGIGVDYSVNVAARWVAEGHAESKGLARESRTDHVIRTAGGAVALCSLTTIIGYSSLLLAENRALFLFGVLAVMGEVCCLTTAIITMPALITFLERRRQMRAARQT